MCGREGRCNMAVSINDMPDKLFLSDYGDNYFVVLDVRKTFVLLWTAFYADYPHQVRKKAKEYEEWLRLSGRVLTPDELIKNIMQRIND